MTQNLRIASWNINSVRLRLPALERFFREQSPDIVCLQETKTMDEFFPSAAIAAMGYPHQVFRGMKSYNGVAILSRVALEPGESRHWFGKEDARHVAARVAGIELHNFYIPAGGDVADEESNPKFAHKLGFIREATEWFSSHRSSKDPMILVGDLNIAPLENDVWSHKYMSKIVSHTPIEIEHLSALQDSAEWRDALRHFVPASEKLYSWWSYRAKDWEESNRGLRLDHIWLTPGLMAGLAHGEILSSMRGWESPSDHVPVVIDLKV